MRIFRRGLAVAAALSVIAIQAGAASIYPAIGGVVTTNASSGGCADTQIVPLNTVQNAFSLSAAATCGGQSATGSVTGTAATASVGIVGTSSGGTYGSAQMAGQVSLIDQWILTPPTTVGLASSFLMPVAINLDGLISADATYNPGFTGFLGYTLSVYDVYDALGAAGGLFSRTGLVTTTGAFNLHDTGTISVNYIAGLPISVGVSLSLSIPGLTNGTVDFLHTGSIFAALPDGWTATTGGGSALDFGGGQPPVSSVPVPASLALMLCWTLGLAGAAARRRRD